MAFKQKYEIIADYIKKGTNRRSGTLMNSVEFGVPHDTGNDGSTAQGNVNYYKGSSHIFASAHTFIDDIKIIECVPLLTGPPEKAWHVRYNVPADNQLFGADANDVGAGAELCYSHLKGTINNVEAYKRYVWYWAYVCYTFKLDPMKDLAGHYLLDPSRRTDPINALSKRGITMKQLFQDIVKEIKECTEVPVPVRAAKDPEGEYHIVTRGDSMWKIAKENGLSLEALIELNTHIRDAGLLQIGDKVYITNAPQEKRTYTVKSGDNLSKIAANFAMELEDLIAYNPQIEKPSMIQVGELINLSGTKPKPAPKPAPAPKPKPKPAPKPTPKPVLNGSLVDYLVSIKQPYTFAARAKLAAKYGISGYEGTENQNTLILKKLTQPAPAKPKYDLPSVSLRRGDVSSNVGDLQVALNALYFKVGKVDSSYGPKTEDAVRRFQQVYLPYEVDGRYGPKTRAKMNQILN